MLNTLLEFCDICKLLPFILVHKKSKISSHFSQSLSLLFLLLLYLSLSSQLLQCLDFSSQEFRSQDIYLPNDPQVVINQNFMMAFKLLDEKLLAEFSFYFHFLIVDLSINYHTSENKYTFRDL
jgi:hypothetical protein